MSTSNNKRKSPDSSEERKRPKREPASTPPQTRSATIVTPESTKVSKKRGVKADEPSPGKRSKRIADRKLNAEAKLPEKGPKSSVDTAKVTPSPQKAVKKGKNDGKRTTQKVARSLFSSKAKKGTNAKVLPVFATPFALKRRRRRRRRRIAAGITVAGLLALLGYKYMPYNKALANWPAFPGRNVTTLESQETPQKAKRRGFFRKKQERRQQDNQSDESKNHPPVVESRSSDSVDMSVLMAFNM